MPLNGFRVRQRTPTLVIATKACPGPRSGIDRCGSLSFAIRSLSFAIRSLSFAIRGIHSPFAASLRHSGPPIRHSREGGNPEGRSTGGSNETRAFPPTTTQFSYLGAPAAAGMDDWHENALERLSSAPAPAGMDDRYENRLPPPVSSFQRKLESRRGGVGDRDEDVDDGAAPVGRNAAACLLGPWLGTSPSATFLPLHCQMLIHGSGKIGWPA